MTEGSLKQENQTQQLTQACRSLVHFQVMLRNHQFQQWERGTREKNSQRSRAKSKQRQEVTTYNRVKERPKLTQNHADPRKPEGNSPTKKTMC